MGDALLLDVAAAVCALLVAVAATVSVCLAARARVRVRAESKEATERFFTAPANGRDLVTSSVAYKLAGARTPSGKSIYTMRTAGRDHACRRCSTPVPRGATYYGGHWNAKYCVHCFLSL
jgi:hypothetical protein